MIITSAAGSDLAVDFSNKRRQGVFTRSLEAIQQPVEDDQNDDLCGIEPRKPWVGAVAMVASAGAMIVPLTWVIRALVG